MTACADEIHVAFGQAAHKPFGRPSVYYVSTYSPPSGLLYPCSFLSGIVQILFSRGSCCPRLEKMNKKIIIRISIFDSCTCKKKKTNKIACTRPHSGLQSVANTFPPTIFCPERVTVNLCLGWPAAESGRRMASRLLQQQLLTIHCHSCQLGPAFSSTTVCLAAVTLAGQIISVTTLAVSSYCQLGHQCWSTVQTDVRH